METHPMIVVVVVVIDDFYVGVTDEGFIKVVSLNLPNVFAFIVHLAKPIISNEASSSSSSQSSLSSSSSSWRNNSSGNEWILMERILFFGEMETFSAVTIVCCHVHSVNGEDSSLIYFVENILPTDHLCMWLSEIVGQLWWHSLFILLSLTNTYTHLEMFTGWEFPIYADILTLTPMNTIEIYNREEKNEKRRETSTTFGRSWCYLKSCLGGVCFSIHLAWYLFSLEDNFETLVHFLRP